MLYLTCTTITNVDIAHYGVSCAKDWVSVDCGTTEFILSSLHAASELRGDSNKSPHTSAKC